jgi:hypothetical protein
VDPRLYQAILKQQSGGGISLGSAAAYGAFGVANSVVGVLAGSSYNSLTREGDYLSNLGGRNLMPDLSQLLKLHYAGMLDRTNLAFAAAFHAADLSRDGLWGPYRAGLWGKVLEVNRPHLPIDLLLQFERQGVAGAGSELRRALDRQGFSDAWQRNAYTAQWQPLDLGTILKLYLLGQFTSIQVFAALKILGVRQEEAQQILAAVSQQLPTAMSLQLMLLGIRQEGDARASMRAEGVIDPTTQEQLLLTRFQVPGPADVLASFGRGNLDPTIVGLWGLDDDQPSDYPLWANRAGLGLSAGNGAYQAAPDGTVSWGDVAWRGHWSLPDMATLANIIHRFRGDPNDQSTWSQPGYPPLSQEQIWRTMGAIGVPTLLRNYLGRLLYNPIPMRQLRIIISNGNTSVPYVSGVLQDNGYSPSDSQVMAQALITQVQNAANAPLVALRKRATMGLVSAVEDAYRAGAVSNPVATESLAAQGIPQDVTSKLLAAVDIRESAAVLRTVVGRARSDIFAGRITLPQALARLTGAGMDPTRAQQVVSSWTAAFHEGRKTLATSKILGLLRKGYISKDAALVRLTNLGWSAADELLLLDEVQGEILKDNAAALKAVEASKQKQVRAIEALIQKQAAGINRLNSRLRVLTPPASVVEWYAEGIWSETRARQQLSLLGYPDDVQSAMLIAALDKSTTAAAAAKEPSSQARVEQ